MVAENNLKTCQRLLSSTDTFANSMDPDHEQQNIAPDLDPDHFTLIVLLEDLF